MDSLTLNDRATQYVKMYVSEHFNKEEFEFIKDKDIYLDRWIDTHFTVKRDHPFRIDNSYELIEAINYCNTKDSEIEVFDRILVMNVIVTTYLYQIVIDNYDILFN